MFIYDFRNEIIGFSPSIIPILPTNLKLKFMRKILIFTSIIMLATFSHAQSYGSGIGVKALSPGGGPFGGAGINYKVFIGGGSALDITVGGASRHLTGQLLYEWQKETGWTSGLDWYIGLGGTLGIWSSNYYYDVDDDYWKHNKYYKQKYKSGFFLGADLVVGLDFNLEPNTGVPIGISLEAGPSVGIVNSGGFGWNSALAVRYIIN